MPVPLATLLLTIQRTHAGPGALALCDAQFRTLIQVDYLDPGDPDRLLAALRAAGARVTEDSDHVCCERGDRCADFARAMGEVA